MLDLSLMTKREAARALLEFMFQERKRITFSEIVATGAEHGITRQMLQLARKELGIRRVYNGPHHGFWEKE